jgi:hypothetical protein
MKYIPPYVILACFFAVGISVASAQETVPAPKPKKPEAPAYILPPGVTEDMLAPPPVPRFMLEKQDKPLSTEEMLKQAREAENTVKRNNPQSVAK